MKPLAECPDDWIAWQNDVVEGPLLTSSEDKNGPYPARMCTVSHCHTILTGNYKYRRCEQHRAQNRHHSQLKRVREKELKAPNPPPAPVPEDTSEFHIWAPRDQSSKKKDDDLGPLFTREPINPEETAASSSADVGESGVASGSKGQTVTKKTVEKPPLPVYNGDGRRKKDVCSVPICQNLLPPTIPWKMCNSCRERDRDIRKNKKLREKGQLPPKDSQPAGEVQASQAEPSSNPSTTQIPAASEQTTPISNAPPPFTAWPPEQPMMPSSPGQESSNDADEVLSNLLHHETSQNNVCFFHLSLNAIF